MLKYVWIMNSFNANKPGDMQLKCYNVYRMKKFNVLKHLRKRQHMEKFGVHNKCTLKETQFQVWTYYLFQ